MLWEEEKRINIKRIWRKI